MAPVIMPKAALPSGAVGLLKFCTLGAAPIDHTGVAPILSFGRSPAALGLFDGICRPLRALGVGRVAFGAALTVEGEEGCLAVGDVDTPFNPDAIRERDFLNRIATLIDAKNAEAGSLSQHASLGVLEWQKLLCRSIPVARNTRQLGSNEELIGVADAGHANGRMDSKTGHTPPMEDD